MFICVYLRFIFLFVISTMMLSLSLSAAPVPPLPPQRAAVEAALVMEPLPENKPLHVVLLAPAKDHGPAGNGLHDYPLWQERWALLMGGRTASAATQVNLHGDPVADERIFEGAPGVTIDRAHQWPDDEQFSKADVIVAYGYLKWNEARKQQVARFLERGGGLVLIHSATWTFPKPDAAVAALVGIGGFTKYRIGSVTVKLTAPDHPIARGLPRSLILEDESYGWVEPAIDPAQTTLLAVSHETHPDLPAEIQAQPVFWIHHSGKGRVFGCVPGHRVWTFDNPWFRLWLLRGIAWSAGGSPYRFDALAPRGVPFQ